MLHANRIWSLSEVESAAELARMLTQQTWCCCQAFMVKGHPRYSWLNDSTSEDGAQEYAVIRMDPGQGEHNQIESITFSWCDTSRAEKFIHETLDGKDDNNEWALKVRTVIQQPDEHGRCQHCA